MKKRGRPANYLRDSAGKEIHGLVKQKDGLYRIVETHQRYVAETDTEAIRIFHQRVAKRKRETVNLLGSPDQFGCQQFISADSDAFWNEVRRVLIEMPRIAAQRTGIKELSHLSALREPTADETLANIGQLYTDKAQVTRQERKAAERYWKIFSESTGMNSLREIKAEHVSSYYDKIIAAKFAPKTIFHHFGKVKCVLNFAAKRGVAADDVARVLGYCKMLVSPKTTSLDPHPISTEHLQRALDATDDWGKAFILTCLNCCMYGNEVGDLDIEDIDFKNGLLVADRGKTKVARVAVLWPRTIKAIEKLLSSCKRFDKTTGPLFLTAQAGRVNGNIGCKFWEDLRVPAKLPKSVCLSHLRDGAYTAACDAGIDLNTVKVLAGHRCGMSDHYLKRRPRIVDAACRAVELEYFGAAKEAQRAA